MLKNIETGFIIFYEKVTDMSRLCLDTIVLCYLNYSAVYTYSLKFCFRVSYLDIKLLLQNNNLFPNLGKTGSKTFGMLKEDSGLDVTKCARDSTRIIASRKNNHQL